MKILILGGTGTLGSELIKQLYKSNDITVLSRDEQKQVAMSKIYPDIRYRLGDITDYDSIQREIGQAELVFHVAALKHVDFLEANVNQCMKVNVLGTKNVVDACRDASATLIFSSTDKAVDPINAYGYSKALAERIVSSQHFYSKIFRWGNVLGSRGSVIPHFIKSIQETGTANITHPAMTRFWITIENAVGYMIENSLDSRNYSEEFIHPDMRAASVVRICESIGFILNKKVDFRVIGIRPGEKLHESLVSVHREGHINSRDCDQYTDHELATLLEPIVKEHLC